MVFPHVEYHIVDNCNLNCAGCSHFSPLYKGTNESYENKIANLDFLLKKFSYIARVDILGGEPLLSNRICDYITDIRKMLPDTWLRIFTNGLLVPRLDEHVLNCIRENNVQMYISEYEPTHKMIDNIINILEEYGITYISSGYDERSYFNLPVTTNNNTKYQNKCISNGCYALGDGKIAKCPTLLYINKFNQVFDQNLPEEGLIDVDTDMSPTEILEVLKKEVPLCKYCIEYPIEWHVCGNTKTITDFAALE